MNRGFTVCAIATSMMLPSVTMAVDTADIKECLSDFAQSYFPGKEAKLVVAEQPRNLAAVNFSHGTHEVAITVTSPQSGDVLATGTCAVRDSSSETGYVTILESDIE